MILHDNIQTERAEGRAEGMKEGLEKNIQGMKNEGIPVETIAKITGLPLEEIEAILS